MIRESHLSTMQVGVICGHAGQSREYIIVEIWLLKIRRCVVKLSSTLSRRLQLQQEDLQFAPMFQKTLMVHTIQ